MRDEDAPILTVIDDFPLYRSGSVPDAATAREIMGALAEGGVDLEDPDQVRAVLVGLGLAMLTGVQGAITDDDGRLNSQATEELIQRGIGTASYAMAYVVANHLRRLV